MTDKSTVIGVDVGGTFTDLFFLNDSTGAIDVVKVPSTRGREADGFLDGLSRNQTDLAQVAQACRRRRRFARCTERGQQDADQQHDNADDHKQLNKGKTA